MLKTRKQLAFKYLVPRKNAKKHINKKGEELFNMDTCVPAFSKTVWNKLGRRIKNEKDYSGMRYPRGFYKVSPLYTYSQTVAIEKNEKLDKLVKRFDKLRWS